LAHKATLELPEMLFALSRAAIETKQKQSPVHNFSWKQSFDGLFDSSSVGLVVQLLSSGFPHQFRSLLCEVKSK
jgi:hypothetical protein